MAYSASYFPIIDQFDLLRINLEKNKVNPSLDFDWDKGLVTSNICQYCKWCCSSSRNKYPLVMKEGDKPDRKEMYVSNVNPRYAYMGARGCKANKGKGCTASVKPLSCTLFPYFLNNLHVCIADECPIALFVPLARVFKIAERVSVYLERMDAESIVGITSDRDGIDTCYFLTAV